MGILADLFVATPPEAAAYEATLLGDVATAEERYDPVHFRGLTDLNFSILWAIVLDEDWGLEKHALTTIRLDEPGDTWLFQFPQPFCKTLAALSDEELARISQAWADTDELARDGWTIDDALRVVERLRCLSIRAARSNESLFLWGSL